MNEPAPETPALPSVARQGRWRSWLGRLQPATVGIDARELWRVVAGAGVGVLFAALASRWLAGTSGSALWLMAPLGASAVLVFAVPASPLAQPWAVVGGNTLSALIGIACTLAIRDPALAACAAVALSIAAMVPLRCLHPPGGATALLVVLLQATDVQFALFPVLVNSLLLVLAGMLYNSVTGRPYPRAQTSNAGTSPPAVSSHFTPADLDVALAHYNQVLDISRVDLQALLESAEMAAYQRHLGALRCGDIMTPDPACVQFGTSLQDAWKLMRQRRVRALPVVDRALRIAGIVTAADFLRHAGLEHYEGIGDRLRAVLRASGLTHASRPEVVGQIMTRQVRVASRDRPLCELIPAFSEHGHHHIPIIDPEGRLVGIITQTDLVRALHRAVRVQPP